LKVTFVYPRFEKFLSGLPELEEGIIQYFLGDFTTPPSLGIPILAALTPPEIQVELVDDNAGQPLDFDAPSDLIAINCFTPQATRAFEIADQFRAHGKKVIMGGLFPTFMAQECLKHADAVNTGEGEPTWPQILADTAAGRLKPIYKGGCSTPAASIPAAKRELFYQNQFYDWDEDLIQVARGCLYDCAMCSLPAQMGGRLRWRPIENVVAEIRGLKHENVYLADDTLFFPQRQVNDYARALLTALEPLGKKYFVSSTMALNTDPAFLDLAARAGVRNFYCTLNVDPFSIKAIQGDAVQQRRLADLVKAIEGRGIRFFASCGMGRDWDDERIGDRIQDLLNFANIHTAEFFLFTPYPGSAHWNRLTSQKRVFDHNWAHYNGAHVVAKPQNMTPEALREQFVNTWKGFFAAQKGRHAAHLEPATWREGEQVVGKPLERQGARRQAVITGIGVLSPIGNDPGAMLQALREGRHGIAPVTRFDASPFRMSLAGEIKNFSAQDWMTPEELSQVDDIYLRYAVAAARQALRHAGLPWKDRQKTGNIALVLATCNGGLTSAEAEYAWKHGRSSHPFDERMNLHAQFYGFGKAMASILGLEGECWVVTTACSSATAALGLAQTLIQRGYHDTVLVGASDALCLANVSGFDALKATAIGQMAPFSLPTGLNIGEGACFWVVETLEKALLRRAPCLGRLDGHATTSDAYHPTTPDPRGAGVHRTLVNALADSGVAIEDIGCINGHGSGTEANDRAESHGVAKFLNGRPIPLVSTKSFFGHCMGATGLMEATSQLLAMNDGFIPSTLNFKGPRPGCPLDCVPNQARVKDYRSFISANYAFGGNNAAVVISKWDAPFQARRVESQRVVITGAGLVTSLGLGVRQTLDNLRAQQVSLTPPSAFSVEKHRSKLVGQPPPFKAADIDRRIDFSAFNPISRFAVAAAKLALNDAGIKTSPGAADDFGVIMGVCNGPSEMGHMDRVFQSDNHMADVGNFSNITPNSTAGWVSNILYLKGVNMTLAPGPHAGLQALAYAFDALAENRARALLAGAADEVYAQTFFNYDGMGFLFSGEEETRYRLRAESDRQKVLGEGAAFLCLETAAAAQARNARVLAEMLGYGMTMDADGFLEPNLDGRGLERAILLALSRTGVAPDAIGLIIWAPQGNRQDLIVLRACEAVFDAAFPALPLASTTFNTGLIESASILVSAAAALSALETGPDLWPQRTGVADLDSRSLARRPDFVLCAASTDIGANFAAVLRLGWTP